jgi:phage tail sheath protein FI
MTNFSFLRPTTRIQEIDLTQRVAVPSSSLGLVIGEFERGPLSPTYMGGSLERFQSLYGTVANPDLSFAHDTCTAFLTESADLLVKRVTNAAKYAGLHTVLDVAGNRILHLAYEAGSSSGYEEGIQAPTLLQFDADLIADNTFNLDITDGVTVTSIAEVTFATSHNATMTAIASAITTALSGYGSGGIAKVYTEIDGSSNRIIYIYPPEDSAISFVGAEVAEGASQAEVEILDPDASHLYSLQAENPGEWANSYGQKLTGFDKGIRERYRLLFTDKLVASNSFTITINGNAITPVVFASDSDQTMAAIATAISNLNGVSTAYVETVPAGRENDRSIIVVADVPGEDQLVITGAAVTGGDSQPAVSVTKILDGIDADGTFVLEIYHKTNPILSAERFTVSLARQTSSRGEQLKIDNVVNTGTINSIHTRVYLNPRFSTDSVWLGKVIKIFATEDFDSGDDFIFYMSGGDDGVAATSANMINSLQELKDRTRYPFSIVMNAGYTDPAYQQALVQLAANRNDSFVILDMPSDKQKAQTARDHRLQGLNINSNFGAIYTPDFLITDLATGERRYVPPSGYVGATYAYNDRVASIFNAPAGLTRGVLKFIQGVRIEYTGADEELMHPNGVNAIVKRAGGYVIMGEETLQIKKSILSSVHARRLLNFIEITIADGLDYTLFEPNNQFTRNNVLQLGRSVLQPIKDAGGLNGYRHYCNESNNPPELQDLEVLNYTLLLKITPAIKGIVLTAILVRTGVSFSEIESEFNLSEAA